MKKLIIGSFVLAFSFSTLAANCEIETEGAVLAYAAKALSVKKSELKVRYLGLETLDSDYGSGSSGAYYTPMEIYYDVFLAEEDPKKSKALTMIFAEVTETTESEDESENGCSLQDLSEVSQDEWEFIYRAYL